MKILDLPFRERPLHELLNFDEARSEVDRTYAGYGWATVPRIWIGETSGAELVQLDSALVMALHSSDVGEVLAHDIELEFEVPDREPVTVLASQFLELWLPQMPRRDHVVLAMCNPHRATLHVQLPVPPIHYALGDVESWIDDSKGGRVELLTDGSWATLAA